MSKIKYIFLAILVASGVGNFAGGFAVAEGNSYEASCPDLGVIFARGSGGKRWEDDNYLAFKAAIEEKLAGTELSYEFYDLDYPAIAMDNLFVILETFVTMGSSARFGKSVDAGVAELAKIVNTECAETKYVIGGYSQGAMVVSKALKDLRPEKVIYAATFGDPKIYLPEGFGVFPAACQNLNLSEYREYVPDCQAYLGKLGGHRPYQPEGFSGKLGTWCNTYDLFCSSYLSLDSHTAYVADGLYEKASEVIFEKVRAEFGIEEKEPELKKDVVILMARDYLIEGKSEWSYYETMKKYAREIIDRGGRVAIYDFWTSQMWNTEFKRICSFDSCTTDNGIPGGSSLAFGKSLIGALMDTISNLRWEEGSEKILVVLGRHRLTSIIDSPWVEEFVNYGNEIGLKMFAAVDFTGYTEGFAKGSEEDYRKVTERLGGETVLVDGDEWEEALLDKILEDDSLEEIMQSGTAEDPEDGIALATKVSARVAKTAIGLEELPELTIQGAEETDSGYEVSFTSSGGRTLVVLNDAILGYTEQEKVVLTDLDRSAENIVWLVPMSETRSGVGREVIIPAAGVVVPLAPNTGAI